VGYFEIGIFWDDSPVEALAVEIDVGVAVDDFQFQTPVVFDGPTSLRIRCCT
jgi:hypothetical protein